MTETFVSVTIDDKEGIIDGLGRIHGNLPFFTDRIGWVVSQVLAKHLRNSRFSHATGDLTDSVKPVKIGEGEYGIEMAGYAVDVDTGRRPGKRPPTPPGSKLYNYAGNMPNAARLSRWIGAHGTQPTHFIDKAMITAEPEWTQSIVNHLDYYLKSGGRATI